MTFPAATETVGESLVPADAYLDAVAPRPAEEDEEDNSGYPFERLLDVLRQATPGTSSTRNVYYATAVHGSGNLERHCFAHVDTLSFETQLSRRLVQMRIRELVQVGLLVPVPHPPGQKRRSRRYQVRVGIDISHADTSVSRPFPRLADAPAPDADQVSDDACEDHSDGRQLCLFDGLDSGDPDEASDPEDAGEFLIDGEPPLPILCGYQIPLAAVIVGLETPEGKFIAARACQEAQRAAAEHDARCRPGAPPAWDEEHYQKGNQLLPMLTDRLHLRADSVADARAETAAPSAAADSGAVESPGDPVAADDLSPVDAVDDPASPAPGAAVRSDPDAQPVAPSAALPAAGDPAVSDGSSAPLAEPYPGAVADVRPPAPLVPVPAPGPARSRGAATRSGGFTAVGDLVGALPSPLAARARAARGLSAAPDARPPSGSSTGFREPSGGRGVQPVAPLRSRLPAPGPASSVSMRPDPGDRPFDVSRKHAGGASPFNEAAHGVLERAGWRFDGACWHGPDCRHVAN